MQPLLHFNTLLFNLVRFKNLIPSCKVCCGRTIPLTCYSINRTTLETVKTLYVYKFTQMTPLSNCWTLPHFYRYILQAEARTDHPGFCHSKTSLWRTAGASQTLSTTPHVQHHLGLIFIFGFQCNFINCIGLWEVKDLFIYWEVWLFKKK